MSTRSTACLSATQHTVGVYYSLAAWPQRVAFLPEKSLIFASFFRKQDRRTLTNKQGTTGAAFRQLMLAGSARMKGQINKMPMMHKEEA